jgi:ADP-ribose pyrophosphatase YjhB (NUDIX family)
MEGKYMLVSGPAIIDGGKVLLVKDRKDDFYKLPGGEVVEGEEVERACLRNAREKVNADLEIKKLLCVDVLWQNPTSKEKMTIVLFNFLVKLKNKKELRISEKIIDMRWISIKDIKQGKTEEKISPNTMFAIGFL